MTYYLRYEKTSRGKFKFLKYKRTTTYATYTFYASQLRRCDVMMFVDGFGVKSATELIFVLLPSIDQGQQQRYVADRQCLQSRGSCDRLALYDTIEQSYLKIQEVRSSVLSGTQKSQCWFDVCCKSVISIHQSIGVVVTIGTASVIAADLWAVAFFHFVHTFGLCDGCFGFRVESCDKVMVMTSLMWSSIHQIPFLRTSTWFCTMLAVQCRAHIFFFPTSIASSSNLFFFR